MFVKQSDEDNTIEIVVKPQEIGAHVFYVVEAQVA
jgi:hypothetical protein